MRIRTCSCHLARLAVAFPFFLFPGICVGQPGQSGFANPNTSVSESPAPSPFDLSTQTPAPVAAPGSVPSPYGLESPSAPTTPSANRPPYTPPQTGTVTVPTQRPLRNQPQTQTALAEPTVAMLQQNPKLIQSVPAPGHPLAGYLNAPLPSQTPNVLIGGKALSIAELLQNAQGDTFQNPATRRVLLQSYWELVGKLAEYNCRLQAEQQAGGTNAPRDLKAASALNLLRQERRVAEIEFVKQQWQLAELIRRAKGDSSAVSEADLPIPTDYPLFKTYETHADKLARMERSRHLGRMIPIQEQLVQSRLSACRETFDLHSGMPASSQDFLQMLSRRTEAFLEMTQAIVDYNKMIAEYASLTIAPGVSRYRLVGALVELPKFNIMAQTQPGTTAYTPMFAPMQAAEQATPAPLTLGNALPQERAGLDSVSNSVMNPVSPAYGRNLAGTESDIAQVSHEERQTAMPPSRPAVMPPISSLDDKPQELPPSAMSDGAQAEY